MVLYCKCQYLYIVNFIELRIPFEDVIRGTFERKKLKYAELVAKPRQQGWASHTRPVEMGVRGFVAKSTKALLLDLSFRGRSLKGALKELPKAPEKASQMVVTETRTDYLGS